MLPIPERHVGEVDDSQPELPLSADGMLRYVWHGKFGDVLLEVRDGRAFVNGQPVDPAPSEMQR